jgi:hypothetical protein
VRVLVNSATTAWSAVSEGLGAAALAQNVAQSSTGASSPVEMTVTPVAPIDTQALGVFMQMNSNGLMPAALQGQTSFDLSQGSADATTLDKYREALDSNARTGADAQAVAAALVASMQQLVSQRPDLANAQFDFQSDNGTIKVTSGSLGSGDRAWLQNLLNGNGALVQAVKTFHSDLVGGYAAWAAADGQPLSSAQSDEVSKQADSLVSFMNLFGQMGASSRVPNEDTNVYMLDGAKIDLTQNPGSAAGFLGFMQSAQAVANGTDYTTTPNGRAYGVDRFNVFEQSLSAPSSIRIAFFPSSAKSLGVHETA